MIDMTKRPVTVYIDSPLSERIKKAKQMREKLFPPGWTKVSSYVAHLVEEGLKTEELVLDQAQKELRQKNNNNLDGTKIKKKEME
jgi:hypothetical protein